MNLRLSINKTLAISAVSAALFVSPIFLEKTSKDAGFDLSFGASVEAQAAEKTRRRLPGISEKIFKDLGKVQEFTNPDLEKNPNAKPDFRAAYKELNRIEKRCDDCNNYEKSQVYNMFAYVAYTLEKYDDAVEYYKKVVAQSPQIPVGVELQSLMYIAQLSFQQEKYKQSITYLDRWMKLADETNNEIGPQIWQLKAVICYQSDQKACAFDSINKAISMVESRPTSNVADEGWYNLQRSLYLDDEDFKTATGILEKMIKHYPKKSYWNQLGSMYGMLEREDDQLAAMDATYLMGGLSKEKEILNLAYLYMAEDVPAKAAKIIVKGMDKKQIERSEKNLEVLALAYRQAKEPLKAIPVLEELGKKSANGNAYVQLIGVYLDLNRPRDAVKAGNLAFKKGKFKKGANGEALVNQGIAYFETRQFDKAISNFEKASKIKRQAKFARNWKRYSENEKKRFNGLKDALASLGVDIEKVIN